MRCTVRAVQCRMATRPPQLRRMLSTVRNLDAERERALLSANAVAETLISQGNVTKGCDILGGVLDGLRDLHGDRHPDVLSTAGFLAQQLIRRDGARDNEMAESLAREACEHAQLLWGDGHPEYALAASTLGMVLAHRGQLREAEHYMRLCHKVAANRTDAAAGSSSTHARRELHVASSNLAQILIEQNCLEESLPYARSALEESTALLGTYHAETLEELHTVGRVLEAVGEMKEAEQTMRIALERNRAVHGDEHPRTLLALSSLARLLGGSEDCLDEAEALMREDVRVSKRVHGPSHRETLAAVSNLAQVLYKREQYEAAMPLARDALRISEQVFGVDHEHTALMECLLESVKEAAQHELVASGG